MTRRLGISGDIALRCAWLLTFGLIAAAGMSVFGRSCWPCDLLGHFPGHLAAVALATSATFAVAGHIRVGVVPAAVAVWSLSAFIPFYAAAPTLASLSDAPVLDDSPAGAPIESSERKIDRQLLEGRQRQAAHPQPRCTARGPIHPRDESDCRRTNAAISANC